jgi:hypothetical protein
MVDSSEEEKELSPKSREEHFEKNGLLLWQ